MLSLCLLVLPSVLAACDTCDTERTREMETLLKAPSEQLLVSKLDNEGMQQPPTMSSIFQIMMQIALTNSLPTIGCRFNPKIKIRGLVGWIVTRPFLKGRLRKSPQRFKLQDVRSHVQLRWQRVYGLPFVKTSFFFHSAFVFFSRR